MRGLTRVELAINNLGAKVVSVDLYLADKARTDARIKDLEVSAKESEKSRQLAEERAEDQRSRNRWTILALVATPFVTILVTFLLRGSIGT
jgi:hypothetical protein